MTEEQDVINIFSLFDKTSEIIFIYSDKYNILFFFYNYEENALYKITTDKFFNIEYVDEIEIPEEYKDFREIKIFKPVDKNGFYSFPGLLITDKGDYKFIITDDNTVVIEKETQYRPFNKTELLTCLNEFNIISFIQKKNKFYAIAFDKAYENYCFIEADIDKNQLTRCFSLYSDEGEVIPITINIDIADKRIYVGGKIEYEVDEFTKSAKPFLEMFLLPC